MSLYPSPRSRDGGIDEVRFDAVDGRLWLCGKHVVGPDPEAALARSGASSIVSLNERHELADRYPAYVAWLTEDSRATWWPIPDLHAPAIVRGTEMARTLADRLGRGEGLLLHCGAGIGRAGTMATATLIVLGYAADDASERVARCRPGAGPEVGAQAEFISALAFACR